MKKTGPFKDEGTLLILILFFLTLIPNLVLAHPVAYEGAYSYMGFFGPKSNENTLVYSPRYWLGTGIKHVRAQDKKWTNAHLGFLLKRWNELDSQGNVYLFTGPGIYEYQGHQSYFTRMGAQADWESRRFYTMARYSRAQWNDGDFEDYQTRLGFAPYLANYEELNSWGILQFQYTPDLNKKVTITPTLRMFYKNVLWEVGSSLDGNWMFNFMIRY